MGSGPLSSEFRWFELTGEDIAPCVQILKEQFPHEGYDPALVKSLWPKLLASGQMKAVVLKSPRGEIATFGASTFLSEAFTRTIGEPSRPLIGSLVMNLAAASKPSICSVREIARPNA